jgi:dihydrofolate reductase
MFNWLTADAYIAATDGSLDWVVPDPEQVKAAVETIPRFQTLLFGRKTFELFEGFWKEALDDGRTAPTLITRADQLENMARLRSG